EIWEMLEYAVEILEPYGVTVLPEIHEHYTIQQKIAEKGFPVYDFALPMLVLHALYSGKAEKLLHWLEICPRDQFTTLDTHDGIGVVDVKDLLTQEEVDFAVEALYEKGANLKRIYSSEAYNNLDIYQINCTYYSALGNNDAAYLLARAIQCFTPGIPQIYYVGLLAGENDLELLENSKEGRNINRHYYSLDEIGQEIERPVVKDLFRLLAFRNTAKAFDGDLKITMIDEGAFTLTWATAEESASLTVDLPTNKFSILHRTAAGDEQIF
ncbi:MAG: sucrose phosphorylase, partial [Trichococcus flocculiformis]